MGSYVHGNDQGFEIGGTGQSKKSIQGKRAFALWKATNEIEDGKKYYPVLRQADQISFICSEAVGKMTAHDTEVEKAFGDLRVTLCTNRDGVLSAFGLNGVKKAEPIDLQKAIVWLDLCIRSPEISDHGKQVFSDIKRILEIQLSCLF